MKDAARKMLGSPKSGSGAPFRISDDSRREFPSPGSSALASRAIVRTIGKLSRLEDTSDCVQGGVATSCFLMTLGCHSQTFGGKNIGRNQPPSCPLLHLIVMILHPGGWMKHRGRGARGVCTAFPTIESDSSSASTKSGTGKISHTELSKEG